MYSGSQCFIFLLQLHLLVAQKPESLGICDGFKSSGISSRELPSKYSRPVSRNDNLPTLEMIKENGYSCAEAHEVTTEDGYILTVHRIKGGRFNACPEVCDSCHTDCDRRPVVFLQHDFLGSSADWVMQDPKTSLGYILADSGYDVWLGNFRGNTNSRMHVSLDPKNKDYWQFTFDEMAKYDLPAMIQHALDVSCEGDLMFVGHGLGTTVFMAMHHYWPEVSDLIRLGNLMAPMAYISNMESPLGWLASQEGPIEIFWSLFGDGELLPSNWILDCLASLACSHSDSGNTACHNGDLCTNLIFTFSGYDCDQLNISLVDKMMHHTPAGSSSHTLLHYFQEIKSGGFHGYDWGSKRKNQEHHGMDGFPTYSLWEVESPVAIYKAGENDLLVHKDDATQTTSELPFVVPGMIHDVEYEKWTHMDFVWGIDVKTYVYHDLLANLLHCAHFSC